MIPPPPRSTLFPYTTLFRSYLNTAVGTQALTSNTTGYNNTANGAEALLWNTSGYENSASAPLARSEEHTSELQSRRDLVCRLLLEKKKKKQKNNTTQDPHKP